MLLYKKIQSEEHQAADPVAKDIQKTEITSHQNGQKTVVFQTQELYKVKILAHFHSGGKQKDVNRQSRGFAGDPYPAKAAKQYGYKNITEVWADEVIVYIQGNQNFCYKQAEKYQAV